MGLVMGLVMLVNKACFIFNCPVQKAQMSSVRNLVGVPRRKNAHLKTRRKYNTNRFHGQQFPCTNMLMQDWYLDVRQFFPRVKNIWKQKKNWGSISLFAYCFVFVTASCPINSGWTKVMNSFIFNINCAISWICNITHPAPCLKRT